MGSRWKVFVVLLVGVLVGSVATFAYTAHALGETDKLRVANQLLREDQILVYLERNEIDEAKRVQLKYLESSLVQLELMRSEWPDKIERIVAKRSAKLVGAPKD